MLDLDLNLPVSRQIEDYPVPLGKLDEIEDVVRMLVGTELHARLRADEVGFGRPRHILAGAVFLDVTGLAASDTAPTHSSTLVAREGGSRYAIDAFRDSNGGQVSPIDKAQHRIRAHAQL